MLSIGSVVLVALSVLPLIPPAPLALNTDAVEFSAERAFEHVERIAERPHPMGSAAIVEVRGYLGEELAALGLDADLETVAAPGYFGEPGRTIEVANVASRISGTDSTGAVVLMAHYDTVPTTPGANDNSAAVATVLETARALQLKSAEMVRLLNNAGCPFSAAAKAMMQLIGLDCGPARAPLRNPTTEQLDALREKLDKIGFFEFCSK